MEAAGGIAAVAAAGAPAMGGLAKGWALPNTKEKGLMGSAPDAPVGLQTALKAIDRRIDPFQFKSNQAA